MKSKTNKAFSLIELSIVILVIGILIAGVSQGVKLYDKFKLQTARTITQSSPVAGIKDLVMWLETTSVASFDNGDRIDNNTAIQNWYDINPQKPIKNNAQSSGSNRPIYTDNVVNSLPGIYFDGVNDFMSFNGSFLVGTTYTVFVVASRTDADNPGFDATIRYGVFVGGNSESVNWNLGLAHESGKITFTQRTNTLYISTTVKKTQNIYTFMLRPVGKKFWLNGLTNNTTMEDNQNQTLISFPGAMLGRRIAGADAKLKGYLLELIFYNRNLNDEERSSVEQYLSKKYNLKLS